VVYFGIYYGVFRYVIDCFNLRTPGREPAEEMASVTQESETLAKFNDPAPFVAALGGAANIHAVDACMTRLRVSVADAAAADTAALGRLGARGVVRLSPEALQVVVGPIADQLAGAIRRHLRAAATADASPVATKVSGLLNALGGRTNVHSLEVASTRLLVSVLEAAAVDDIALRSCGVRGIARIDAHNVQVLIGPEAAAYGDALRRLLSGPHPAV
jgi:PTS system N-acetylglucosamine-specific IIC component